MWALLPYLFLVFILGFTALEADRSRSVTPPPAINMAQASGQVFMSYRNALLAYLEAAPSQPAVSGSIPLADLIFPPGVSAARLPTGIGNYVVLGSGGVRTVYVWQPKLPGIIEALNQEFPGDATVGIVQSSQWVTIAGGVMGTVPNYVPAGDVLSVVEIGG